jgi:alkylation response protein AidB-like acyl-CoA dehydrogenase
MASRESAGGGRAVSDSVGQPVVAGVRDLLPVLRERAQETEDARVVPAESVKALAETGFFRLLQPAAFGGHEADPVTFLTAVRLIASGHRRLILAPGPGCITPGGWWPARPVLLWY